MPSISLYAFKAETGTTWPVGSADSINEAKRKANSLLGFREDWSGIRAKDTKGDCVVNLIRDEDTGEIRDLNASLSDKSAVELLAVA
jgi:hypothetical protein